MGYKQSGKAHLINDHPDNEGVYKDLYKEALERIGCKLIIIRKPKKRIHRDLMKGDIDFYPGAAFSKKRSEYLYFIPNGLDTLEYGVSSVNLPEISNLNELRRYPVIWVMGLGSTKIEMADELGIPPQIRTDMSLDVLHKLIRTRPSMKYFFIADKELVDFFPKQKGVKNIGDLGFRIHKECCGHTRPMYMGFSRKSQYFNESPNPDYNAEQKKSPQNFPTIINSETIAGQLQSVLLTMKTEKRTEILYKSRLF